MNNGAAELQDGRRDAGRCQRECVAVFECACLRARLMSGAHMFRSVIQNQPNELFG